MKFLRDSEGNLEWIKIIVGAALLWAAWVTYSSYEVRHILDLETRMERKFETTKSVIHMRVSKANDRVIDDMRELRSLVMSLWQTQVEGKECTSSLEDLQEREQH